MSRNPLFYLLERGQGEGVYIGYGVNGFIIDCVSD